MISIRLCQQNIKNMIKYKKGWGMGRIFTAIKTDSTSLRIAPYKMV